MVLKISTNTVLTQLRNAGAQMPEPTPAPLIQKIEMDAGALQAAWSFIAQKSNNAGCGWPEIAILGISPPLKYEGTQTAVAGAYARS